MALKLIPVAFGKIDPACLLREYVFLSFVVAQVTCQQLLFSVGHDPITTSKKGLLCGQVVCEVFDRIPVFEHGVETDVVKDMDETVGGVRDPDCKRRRRSVGVPVADSQLIVNSETAPTNRLLARFRNISGNDYPMDPQCLSIRDRQRERKLT